MKKSRIFLFLFAIATCLLLIGSNIKPKAIELKTSDLITVEGAQIRTTEPMALRFVGKSNNYVSPEGLEIASYGILIAYGQVNTVDGFVIGGTLNEYNILSGECETLNDNNQYYVNLIGIPENDYAQYFTARAYVKLSDGSIVYGNNLVCRCLLEIALKAKNNLETNPTLLDIITKAENHYFISYFDNYDNIIITNKLYELDIQKLEKEFVKDWNKLFGTKLTDLSITKDQNAFLNSTSIGMTSTPATDTTPLIDCCKDTNMYKFFNSNPGSSAKWKWLLELFKNECKLKVHPKRQINALLSEDGLASDSYGDNLNGFKHLVGSICGFFHKNTYTVGGMDPIPFKDSNVYDKLSNYNNGVFINLKDYNLITKGEEYKCEVLNYREGYTIKYKEGTNIYNEDDSVVVNNVMKLQRIEEPTEYTITYKNKDGSVIDGLTPLTYNIETGATLPTLDNPNFVGWYLDKECVDQLVPDIKVGQIGNIILYAKLTEEETVNITLDYNDAKTPKQIVSEFYNDVNKYDNNNKRFLTTKERSYAKDFAPMNAAMKHEEFFDKWQWLIDFMIEAQGYVGPKAAVNEIKAMGNPGIYHFCQNIKGFRDGEKPLNSDNVVCYDFGTDPQGMNKKICDSTKRNNKLINIVVGTEILETPTRDGYIFDGWYTTKDCQEGTKVTQVENEMTVYAKWVEQNP